MRAQFRTVHTDGVIAAHGGGHAYACGLLVWVGAAWVLCSKDGVPHSPITTDKARCRLHTQLRRALQSFAMTEKVDKHNTLFTQSRWAPP